MSPEMMRRMIDRSMARQRPAFRAVLTGINTTSPIALVQADGLAGEQLQDNELMQHYGYASAPPSGTQAVVIPVGGKTAHGIIIATEHATYRLKGLKSGEAAIYDDLGQSVYLTRKGIVINGAGLPLTVNNTPLVTVNAATKVALNTPELAVSGKINAGGHITDNAGSNAHSMAQMRTIYNGHNHVLNDVQGGSSALTTNVPTQQE